MSLKIRYFGDPVLKETGQKVEDFGPELARLSIDMLELMHQSEGIGLAAQQIGKALQFFVTDVPDHPDYPITCILDGKPLSPSLIMPLSMANPVVETLPSDEYYYEEGCLSFPELMQMLPDRKEFWLPTRIWMELSILWSAMDYLPAAFNTRSII